MIKIGQLQGFFEPTKFVFEEYKHIKKIGIQTEYFKNNLFINGKKIEVGNTNRIQFDNLNETINISFTNKDGDEEKKIFAIIDYEERIDE
jgi:hypothetical protein